nr:MAG: major capsid protein [Microviridae sp.]
MKSPFSKESQYEPQVKRNAFDLSHQNNLTMKMGYLYPCLCQEVIPGDTFEIDTAFGIRMLPLLFPIQTKIRVDLHYFYVRNRYLWSDWQNFITSNDSAQYRFPTLFPPADMPLGTGSLCDYLGLPTRQYNKLTKANSYTGTLDTFPGTNSIYQNSDNFDSHRPLFGDVDNFSVFVDDATQLFILDCRSLNPNAGEIVLDPNDTFDVIIDELHISSTALNDAFEMYVSFCDNHYESVRGLTSVRIKHQPGTKKVNLRFSNFSDSPLKLTFANLLLMIFTPQVGVFPQDARDLQTSIRTITYRFEDIEAGMNAFMRNIPISALPFRAYEAIYNSFYRDQRNNPLTDNQGIPTPNTYVTTQNGGSDSTNYHLFKRNWEQDCFTTALPTPQQGPAPIVGVSALGTASVASSDGKIYKVKLATDGSDNIVNFEDSAELPADVRQSLVGVATSGFTINDFRSVNSLQRWLESNFRQGIKYRDQIKSHFGVDVKFDELDMPEFLGGVSQYINIDQINQTTETSTSPLGSYAGQGSAIGSQKSTIKRYFDEHGFVIGIISVTPTPVYSQQLPKLFTKTGNLDYYFPEFGHIGFQPVPLRELCPHQLGQDKSAILGYQRPFYDYLQALDSVHGLFRTDYKDFVLQRTFQTLPSLTPEFLTVDEAQLNDVFAVDAAGNADRFLGQVHFKITAQRPIPRYGVPKLE